MYVRRVNPQDIGCGLETTFLVTTLQVKLGSYSAFTSRAVGIMTHVAATGRSSKDEK
jgi:hypothetical protein